MAAGMLHRAATVAAVMVGTGAGRPLRPLTIHLDFGIVEFALVGTDTEEVYLVRFTCGCVGLVRLVLISKSTRRLENEDGCEA